MSIFNKNFSITSETIFSTNKEKHNDDVFEISFFCVDEDFSGNYQTVQSACESHDTPLGEKSYHSFILKMFGKNSILEVSKEFERLSKIMKMIAEQETV